MWPFKKKKPESPEDEAALERLDEATREVSAGELHREPSGMLAMLDPLVGPLGDAPPGTEPGLREALRDGEEERDQKSPDGEKS
jgi:hypothetical protein